MTKNSKIKVLVIDDSALVRDILSRGIGMDDSIEVIGTASDPYIARDKIVKLKPDVLTLDVEMPRMDGLEFLRKLMPQYPLPVIMVSALTEHGKRTTLDALELGAVDFVTKPSRNVQAGLNEMMLEIRTKIKIASTANVSHWKHSRDSMVKSLPPSALTSSTDKIVAIGASTGGTEAIAKVIKSFPANMSGTVIVQHMPPGFTKLFAERLNSLSAMEVKEAEDGDRIMQGRVLVAPGGKQLRVKRSGGTYLADIGESDLVCGHCPSVEAMMQSVASNVGANAIGVMLTGMGSDGSDGMKAMRDAAARTVAQDEATCVVFGMPNVAFEKGGVECLRPITEIATHVINLLKEV